MRHLRKLVWTPFFGLWFVGRDPEIINHIPWLFYQLFCVIGFKIGLSYYIISLL